MGISSSQLAFFHITFQRAQGGQQLRGLTGVIPGKKIRHQTGDDWDENSAGGETVSSYGGTPK